MNALRITISAKPSAKTDLVCFHAKDSRLLPVVPKQEFNGARHTTCLLRDGTRRVLHVGLGSAAQLSAHVLRQAAGQAAKALGKLGSESISIDLRGFEPHAQAVTEGVVLATYRFEDFKAPEARRKTRLKTLELWVASSERARVEKASHIGQVQGEAANLTRSIGNQPPNVLNPRTLAEHAQALSKTLGVKCRVWDEKDLKRQGFGGIVAVGQGSANPPRFIALEVPAPSASVPTVVIVGKAITFDTGGISIKPADRMEEMKWDKMGGCAVLGIVQAVRRLKLPIRCVGLIASAENMPSDRAYRPSDLVTTWDGKVIEVLNTDAEGRVVLADALAYGRKTYRPDLMIDLATLTGACVVALGGKRAGLFTDDLTLRQRLIEIGEETGDRVWPLPMGEEYDDQIRSDAGLVKNTGGREGGACTAASFLRHWAGETKWAHLDIAGPAMGGRDVGHLEKGATGFGVRLVTQYLMRYAKDL